MEFSLEFIVTSLLILFSDFESILGCSYYLLGHFRLFLEGGETYTKTDKYLRQIYY